MVHFKSLFINYLRITLFCSTFINATPEQEQECYDAMEKSFGLDTPLNVCIRLAIIHIDTSMSFDDYVRDFYLSFKEKIIIESVSSQNAYCTDLVSNIQEMTYEEKETYIRNCENDLSVFGDTKEKILDAVLYKHRKGAVSDQAFVHPNTSKKYFFMERITHNIAVKAEFVKEITAFWCKYTYENKAKRTKRSH